MTQVRLFTFVVVLLVTLGAAGCRAPSGSIEGQVTLADAEDASGTAVVLRGSVYAFQTRADGRFWFRNLEPGTYDVVFEREGYEPAGVWSIEVKRGRSVLLERRALQPLAPPVQTAAIEGFVALDGAVDNSGVRVELVGEDLELITDASGQYAFKEVLPGTYSVRASRPGYSVATRADIVVATGEAAHLPTLLLEPLPETPAASAVSADVPSATVAGRALCSGTLDYSGISIELQGTGRSTVTLTDGRFELSDVPFGTWPLVASRSGCGEYRQTVVVDAERVELAPMVLARARVSAPAGAIAGIVVLDGAEDHSGTLVFIDELDLYTESGPDGAWRIDDVPGGTHQLVVSHPGYQDLEVFGVVVRPNETATVARLTLLPALDDLAPAVLMGSVLIEGEPDLSGVTVSAAGTGFVAVTDANGEYTMTGVAPGVYDIQATKPGYDSGALAGVVVKPGDELLLPAIVLELRQDRPKVLYTAPADGDRRVEVDQELQLLIGFSQDMDPRTVAGALRFEPPVTIAPAESGGLPGSGKRVFAFVLKRDGANPLKLETSYTGIVAESAANLEGVGMEEPYVFRFSTGGPRIVRVNPPDGAANLSLGADDFVFLETNVPVDIDYWRKAITIRGARGQVIDLYRVRREFGDRVMLDTSIMEEGTRLTVTVGNSARTADGERFENVPYRWSFSTVPVVGGSTADDGRSISREEELYREGYLPDGEPGDNEPMGSRRGRRGGGGY